MSPIPDAEALYVDLLAGVKALMRADTKLVGVTSGGAWLGIGSCDRVAYQAAAVVNPIPPIPMATSQNGSPPTVKPMRASRAAQMTVS